MDNYLFSKKFFLKPYLKNITQNDGDGFSSVQLQWLLSSFKLVCISEVASPSSFIVSFLSKLKMNSTNWPAPNDEVPHNSVGRALHFFVILILQRPWVPFEFHWKSPISIIGGRGGGCLICYLLKIFKRTVTIISSFHFCISAAHITFMLSIFIIIIITFTITFIIIIIIIIIIIHTLPFAHLYQLLSLEPLQSHLHFFPNIKY